MDTLVIAPTLPELKYSGNELSIISDILKPKKVLSGMVTARDLFEELLQNNYELIWFITHSDSEGIWLSDGERLTPDRLSQYLKRSKPAIILNTCDSEEIALDLHNVTNSSVIFAVTSIEDQLAYEFGALLATALGRDDLSLTDAYEISTSPYQKTYFMIGKEQKTSIDKIDKLYNLVSASDKKVTATTRKISDDVLRLDGKIENLEDRVEGIENHIKTNPRLFNKEMILSWSIAYMLYSILLLLGIFEIRKALMIQVVDYSIIWILGISLAYFLFSYGMGFNIKIK